MDIFEKFKTSALWPYILLVPAICGGIDLWILILVIFLTDTAMFVGFAIFLALLIATVVYIIYYKKTRKD